MKKRMLSLGMAVILAATALAGCGSGNTGGAGSAELSQPAAAGESQTAAPAAPAADGADSNVLYSNGGPEEFFETPWLNPGSYFYSKVLYDHLIVADNSLAPKEGQLAESYELAEDGKTLTFTMRDNIFWHDGEPITPEDIKWSIEYSLKTTVLNSVFTATFSALEGAEEYLAGRDRKSVV